MPRLWSSQIRWMVTAMWSSTADLPSARAAPPRIHFKHQSSPIGRSLISVRRPPWNGPGLLQAQAFLTISGKSSRAKSEVHPKVPNGDSSLAVRNWAIAKTVGQSQRNASSHTSASPHWNARKSGIFILFPIGLSFVCASRSASIPRLQSERARPAPSVSLDCRMPVAEKSGAQIPQLVVLVHSARQGNNSDEPIRDGRNPGRDWKTSAWAIGEEQESNSPAADFRASSTRWCCA